MFKKSFAVFLLIILLPLASAQQSATDIAGVTPDSFLWGIDRAIDQLSLLLTFDKGEKAKKGLEIAQERLSEIKLMVQKNDLKSAEKAREAHNKTLQDVGQDINDIKESNSTVEIKKIVSLEKEMEKHDKEVEKISGDLKVKIEVEGNLTSRQRESLNALLKSLKGQSGEVKIKISNKKDEIKEKIENETGKSGEEIDSEIEDIEKSEGVESEDVERDGKNDGKDEHQDNETETEHEREKDAVEAVDDEDSVNDMKKNGSETAETEDEAQKSDESDEQPTLIKNDSENLEDEKSASFEKTKFLEEHDDKTVDVKSLEHSSSEKSDSVQENKED